MQILDQCQERTPLESEREKSTVLSCCVIEVGKDDDLALELQSCTLKLGSNLELSLIKTKLVKSSVLLYREVDEVGDSTERLLLYSDHVCELADAVP